MENFPTVDAPKPIGYEAWSPDNRADYDKMTARGFHRIPCPDCRKTAKKLFRCGKHRHWGK